MSAHPIAQYLLIIGVKSSLLFVGAGLLTLGMRRRGAAIRHVVWLGAIVGSALLPAVGVFVPAVNVPILATRTLPESSPPRAPSDEGQVLSAPATLNISLPNGERSSPLSPGGSPATTPAQARVVDRATVLADTLSHVDGALALLIVWTLGTMWLLSQTLLSILALTRVRRRAEPVTGLEWEQALGAIRRRNRRITLLVSHEVDVPLTWGILRPVILLPRGADEWSPSRRELVLRHELAHVDRYDVLTQLIARVVRAMHWPNPMAWLAERGLRRECEQACDDCVLAAGVRPTRYAEELLEIACALTARGFTSLAPGFASRPSLEVRLQALLDARSTRRGATRVEAMFMVIGVLALAVPLAALTPAPRSVSSAYANDARAAAPAILVSPPPVAIAAPSVSRHALKLATAPMAAPAAAMSLGTAAANQLCPSSGGSHTNSTQERQGTKTWEVHWTGRDCAVDLRAEGDIRFNDDVTDIASISPNGFFDLSVRDGDELTRLVVKPMRQGELGRRYTVNGAEHAWDTRAREWFADFLLELERQSGFAVDTRFPKLLARGVPAVLEEIKTLGSDYVRGLYFQRLLERANLSPSQLRQTLEVAGHDVRSDYELARILVGASDRYGLRDEDTRAAYINAVNSLSSDYERNRALHALLSRSDLSPREASAILQSASALTSDYELARTLVAMTDKKLISPALHPLYLEDAGKISSDYERARVILALLGTGKLPNNEVAQVIGLAGNIKSDYERSRVLIAVADAYDLGDDARDAYLKAARSISAEYERGRALAALRAR